MNLIKVYHASHLVQCDAEGLSYLLWPCSSRPHLTNLLRFFKCECRLPFVSSLRDCCSPSTVARFVVTVRVNSIKRCFWWPNTNISEKGSKVSPPFADSYTRSAILTVAPARAIRAALNHACPRGVCARLVHAVRVHPLSGAFRSHTAARPHEALLQTVHRSHVLSAAVACTAPKTHTPLFFSGRSQRSEFAKNESGNIFDHGQSVDAIFLVVKGRKNGRR